MVANKKPITLDIWAWYAFLATLVLTPLAVGTIPFSGSPFMVNHTSALHGPMLWLGVGVTTVLMIMDVLINKRELRLHWSQGLLAIGALAVLASTVFSLDVWSSIGGNMNDELVTTSWLALIACAFLGAQMINSRERVDTLLNVLLYTGWFIAGLTLLDQVFELEVFTPERLVDQLWIVHMGGGVFGNPDIMGVFLVIPAVLAVGRALSSELKSSWLFWIASIMISLSLLRTLTRAAWIALAIGVLACAVIHLVKRRGFLPIVLLVGAATLSIVLMLGGAQDYDLQPKVQTFTQELTPQSGSRVALVREALSVTAMNPLTGTGPANYRLGWSLKRIIGETADDKTFMNSDAHSLPLQMTASIGLLAALCLIAYIVYSGVAGLLFIRKQDRGTASDDSAALVLVALVSSLIAASASISNISILLWIVGLTPVCLVNLRPSKSKPNLASSLLVGSGVLLAVSLFASLILVPGQHFSGARAYTSAAVGEGLLTVGDRLPRPVSYSAFGAAALTSEMASGGSPLSTSDLEMISRAVDAHPNDAAMLYAAARALATSGALQSDDAQIQAGLSYALLALDRMPYYAEAVTLVAQIYVALGDYDKAAVALADFEARVGLSKSMQKLKDQIIAAQSGAQQ